MTTNNTSRTTITLDDGDVTVTWLDPMTDEMTTTKYFVPVGGGYVRIRDKSGRCPQVCTALATSGDTLMSSRDGLLATIRREHKSRARKMRRFMARA
jgi:hypothetical protein